jgi:hypothetical protein
MKTFKITSKSLNVYQIERSDKHTPMRYLVQCINEAQAQEVCTALSENVAAAIEKYEIDACLK